MLSDKWLPRYRLLDNVNTKNLVFEDVLDFDPYPHPPGMDPGVRSHGMKANPIGLPMVQV